MGLVGVVALGSALVVCATAGSASSIAPKLPRFGAPRPVVTTDVSDKGSARLEGAADFNGDGYLDVVLVRAHWRTFDTYPIQIFLANRRGGFYDGTSRIFDGPPPRVQFPRKLVISDFNADGRADMFVADTGYDSSPGPGYQNSLILSTPEGKLRDATANLPQLQDFSHSASAADVNGDGTVDLYVGNIYGEIQKHGPEVLFNDGRGRFRACEDCLPRSVNEPFGNSPTWASSLLVDVNADGAPDLVLGPNGIVGIGTPPPMLLLNDGSGHFHVSPHSLPAAPFGGTGQCVDFVTADLNRDRHPDLLAACTKTDPYYVGRWIQILVNNGDGTFRDETAARLPQLDNSATWMKWLHLVDLNGDGMPDIVGQLVEGEKGQPPVYVNERGSFRALAPGYSHTVDNVFALVDARGSGHRDFFTTTTYGYPSAVSYVVRQVGKPLRPGRPALAVITRSGNVTTLWWPYDWGAVRYQVWRAASTGAPRKLLATTRRMRFVDRGAPAHAAYWLRAVNSAGQGAFGDPSVSP